MKKLLKSVLNVLLALSLCLIPVAAYADDTAALTPESQALAEMSIFDDAELTSMVESFIDTYSGYNVKRERISIAYTYLATGETWYYNPDTWYYSASMYKVPLMMILAQQEADGKLTQESDIKGITLAKAEESILVYSNNDFAHLMLNYLGTDQQAREMYKQFSALPEDYYHSDFVDYSYFTVRFMDDVMNTLYSTPERFPNILDCLKRAQPENYFHLYTDPSLTIAQKYGSYNEWNGTTGIIYLDNPIILTVMTERVERAEEVIAQAAKLFVDYTPTLDARLAEYSEQREAAQELAEEAEFARVAAEEAEQQRLAQQEAERLAQEELRKAQEAAEREQLEKAEARKALLTKLFVGAALAAALIISGVVGLKKMSAKKAVARRTYRTSPSRAETGTRTYRASSSRAATGARANGRSQNRSSRGGHTPKH